jgi:hypothetical protein
MAAIMSAKGSGRKTLAEQLDRMDALLDRVAENLDEAVMSVVAAAVKEVMPTAVQEAVHTAVLEVLAEARRQKQAGTTPLPNDEPRGPVPVRLADRARRCWAWVVGAAQDAWDTLTTMTQATKARALDVGRCLVTAGRSKAEQVREQLTARARVWWMRLLVLGMLARRLRRRLLVSLGIGVAVGLVAYLAGPVVVPVAFALLGFAASMMVGVWEPVRQQKTTPEAGGG